MKSNPLPEMESGEMVKRRIIGLDMHPDVFTAAALIGSDAVNARVEWTHHRRPQEELESWLERHVSKRCAKRHYPDRMKPGRMAGCRAKQSEMSY